MPEYKRAFLLLFLIIILLGSPNLACDSYSGPTATIGKAEIKLLAPSGLIRVDGANARADEGLKSLLSPQTRLLACYAEADDWQAVIETMNSEGFARELDYYASVTTNNDMADQDLDQNVFNRYVQQNTIPSLNETGAELVELGPRSVTIRITFENQNTQESIHQIITKILINKKVVDLHIITSGDSPHKNKLENLAIKWRDAYLEQTKP